MVKAFECIFDESPSKAAKSFSKTKRCRASLATALHMFGNARGVNERNTGGGSVYHNGGCGFAFADGHSESHKWFILLQKKCIEPPSQILKTSRTGIGCVIALRLTLVGQCLRRSSRYSENKVIFSETGQRRITANLLRGVCASQGAKKNMRNGYAL
jgi:prepilin-type processing-associated H-X9-DG protein